MTQEEKAKAYDEVIKKAESLYKAAEPMSGCNVIIETLFPELKESEDERTRKELVSFLEICQDTRLVGNRDREKWIAWLEKQGEQKASYTTTVETGNGGINALITRELPTDGCDDEQKPAEWSEEDINMIDWLIRCCEEEHKELCNDKYGHQDIVSDLKRDCRKKWDWLESLKNRVAPQNTWKPSDEQLNALHDAAVYVDKSMFPYPKGILMKLYKQLKKLREE